jgi:hypothetical protein
MKLTNKLKNKWWLFTILSGIFAYLNPYFGFFSVITIFFVFFDFVYFIIFKNHYKIFEKKMIENYNNLFEKNFHKEVIFFKIGKLFISVCTLFVYIVIFMQNLEDKVLLASFYVPTIKNIFFLQVICMILAIASILYSTFLFYVYLNSYKQKLNEVEIKQ